MDKIKVSLFYAITDKDIWHETLLLNQGSSVQEAFQVSELMKKHPSLDWKSLGLAIFGKKIDTSYCLKNEDRLELCRPLVFDPMQSRKRRAAHRQAGILKRKHLKPDRAKKIEVDIH